MSVNTGPEKHHQEPSNRGEKPAKIVPLNKKKRPPKKAERMVTAPTQQKNHTGGLNEEE